MADPAARIFSITWYLKGLLHTTLFLGVVAASFSCSNATAQTSMQTMTCGVEHVQTAPIESSANFTAVLAMHSEDDHSKNSHLCETEYALQITQPNGTSMPSFLFGNSVDSWNRPLLFRVDGFSQDGNEVFVFLSEGYYPQSVEVVEYDMKFGRELTAIFLDRTFIKGLSRHCAATLRIMGTSARGTIVLGSSVTEGCSRSQLWELRPNKTSGPTGGVVVPEYPEALSQSAAINKLEAGIPVRH